MNDEYLTFAAIDSLLALSKPDLCVPRYTLLRAAGVCVFRDDEVQQAILLSSNNCRDFCS